MDADRARRRCAWAEATPALRAYHDREYGFPLDRDRDYFERLALEIFQAGLSWRTVLDKRPALRRAFAGFAPGRVAAFGARDRRRLLTDPALIRNRRKVEAVLHNAREFARLARRPGGFRAFLRELPLNDPAAVTRRFRETFRFMGPKIVAEFLMSTGHWPVSHEPGCFLHPRRRPRGRGRT